MNDDILGFQIDFSDEDIRTLLYAVSEALRTWPGGDPEEQERLEMLVVAARGAHERQQLRLLAEFPTHGQLQPGGHLPGRHVPNVGARMPVVDQLFDGAGDVVS